MANWTQEKLSEDALRTMYGRGFAMLKSMGYKLGEGLKPDAIATPLSTTPLPHRLGIGAKQEQKVLTKEKQRFNYVLWDAAIKYLKTEAEHYSAYTLLLRAYRKAKDGAKDGHTVEKFVGGWMSDAMWRIWQSGVAAAPLAMIMEVLDNLVWWKLLPSTLVNSDSPEKMREALQVNITKVYEEAKRDVRTGRSFVCPLPLDEIVTIDSDLSSTEAPTTPRRPRRLRLSPKDACRHASPSLNDVNGHTSPFPKDVGDQASLPQNDVNGHSSPPMKDACRPTSRTLKDVRSHASPLLKDSCRPASPPVKDVRCPPSPPLSKKMTRASRDSLQKTISCGIGKHEEIYTDSALLRELEDFLFQASPIRASLLRSPAPRKTPRAPIIYVESSSEDEGVSPGRNAHNPVPPRAQKRIPVPPGGGAEKRIPVPPRVVLTPQLSVPAQYRDGCAKRPRSSAPAQHGERRAKRPRSLEEDPLRTRVLLLPRGPVNCPW
eukprot:GEMP01025147.1.p1 GENE.GEMP01025147.1~~GEMP01025147.1.p1  ORF type:complete len:489 (+),score=123.53 GEMP01025147.1:165-1631(+)